MKAVSTMTSKRRQLAKNLEKEKDLLWCRRQALGIVSINIRLGLIMLCYTLLLKLRFRRHRCIWHWLGRSTHPPSEECVEWVLLFLPSTPRRMTISDLKLSTCHCRVSTILSRLGVSGMGNGGWDGCSPNNKQRWRRCCYCPHYFWWYLRTAKRWKMMFMSWKDDKE